MTDVQIVCSNVCCNPKRPQPFVRRRITQAARIPGIHAGSEIEIPRYWGAWRQIMDRHGMASFGIGHEVPISLDTSVWSPGYRKTHFVHGGKKKISPSRWINEVQTVHTGDGTPLDIFACHPPSWGYPGAKHKAGSSYPWRHQHLELYLDDLRHLVASRVDAGHNVGVVGDMNYPSQLDLHDRQAQLAHAGLDHIWLIPAAGYTVRRLPQHAIPASRRLGMDHPILIGRANLTRTR